MNRIDLNAPLWQLTTGEFMDVVREAVKGVMPEPTEQKNEGKRLVYGLDGIAEIFNCSRTTAQRIKNSGVLDKAITQVGRKITINVDKALEIKNRR